MSRLNFCRVMPACRAISLFPNGLRSTHALSRGWLIGRSTPLDRADCFFAIAATSSILYDRNLYDLTSNRNVYILDKSSFLLVTACHPHLPIQ